MATGGARERSTVARCAVAGTLVLVVLFAGAGLVSASAPADHSSGNRAVIAARDTKVKVVASPASRTRGHGWFASLVGAIACAVFGASLLRSIRSRDRRSDLRQLSFRLRAPPRPLIAH
jgi:hypothetical protein